MTSVSVIIVTYQSAAHIAACLSAVEAQTGANVETIVVDNASSDGTTARIGAEAKVLEMERNVGFAAGANAGAAVATGELLLFLNPDTVMDPRCIAALVDASRRHSDTGIFGGRTLRPDGTLDPRSCWGFPTLWSTLSFAAGLSTVFRFNRVLDPESLGRWARDSERCVDVVTGCLLLVRRDVWEQLGGFDERFFMYCEDIDLCIRAAAAGWERRITPDATVMHEVGASSTAVRQKCWNLRGRALLFTLHHRPWQASIGRSLLVAGVAIRAIGERRTGRSEWRSVWKQRSCWAAAPRESA